MANTHNPQAFPVPEYREFSRGDNDLGMTLRDYFAGQALQGICAYMRDNGVPFANSQEINEAAELAYSVANAMLEARKNT
jgi:hypothetical protein